MLNREALEMQADIHADGHQQGAASFADWFGVWAPAIFEAFAALALLAVPLAANTTL